MSDDRKGLPSASGLGRIALCKGSWLAERDMPADDSSEDANIGNRIHARLAGAVVELSDDERETAMRCASIEATLLPETTPTSEDREVRLWLKNEQGHLLASGQADAVIVFSEEAFIVDYKTGRGEVTEAKGNLQLRLLAVLVSEKHPSLKAITVAIIQPLANPSVTTCTYARFELALARTQILQLLEDANQPDAPRAAGEEQCKYCRARATCEELSRVTAALTKVDSSSLESARLPMLLEACAAADRQIDAIRKHAKELLMNDANAIQGWRLKEGAKVDSIVDPQAVFERCSKKGLSSADFLGAVTVGKGKLRDVLKLCLGATGRSLEVELDEVTAGLTTTKQNAPSLARAKGQE